MPSPQEMLSSLGIDSLISTRSFTRNAEAGTLKNATGTRVLGVGPELLRSLRHVLERERAGSWSVTLKAGGRVCGQKVAANVDAELTALGKPALAALPLDACLCFIDRYFATHGWGQLTLDLADAAEHGVVVAHLAQGLFARVLPNAGAAVDDLLAGMLQGFCEHISGQTLGCEEIACAAHGAAQCTFVITAPERLEAIRPFIGTEDTFALLARLRA